jgi:two-component system cell cycle sensor histidine kinase PleC
MSGTHLLEVISDILDLAKVEANRVVLEENEISIPAVLKICSTLVAGRAEQAGVKVDINSPADLPMLIADELRVKQIVLNLLSNAVKFSPSGAEVRLLAKLAETGELAIIIDDHGCGMTPHEVELALEPFGQVNSAIAKGKEGTGLGLPLARRLTEIHGGRLEIESVPGRGTRARVLFPSSRTIQPCSVAAENAISAA